MTEFPFLRVSEEELARIRALLEGTDVYTYTTVPLPQFQVPEAYQIKTTYHHEARPTRDLLKVPEEERRVIIDDAKAFFGG